MATVIFTPKTDDRHATATELVEVATIKPSGYIQLRGIVEKSHQSDLVYAVKTYYAQQERPEPVIYTRAVGQTDWEALDAPEVTIPDELPEDFN